MTVTPELRILSLGWGVQSWTLAAMMALGELEPADFLVHADTQHERAETYAFRDRWQPWLAEHGLNVVTVVGTRTAAVQKEWAGGSVLIPAFTKHAVTGHAGQVRRQCTREWKIRPIRRFIREEMRRRRIPRRPGVIVSWVGISLDEWQRMRDSEVAYIVNSYPLVDLQLTRAACHNWLVERGLPTPSKSSCTFCPFRSMASWRELGAGGGPDLQEAVDVDAAIRDRRLPHAMFVHPARRPLADSLTDPSASEQMGFEFEQPCDGGACWT